MHLGWHQTLLSLLEAQAQLDQTSPVGSSPDEPGSMGMLLVRTLVVLALVVVGIYLVLNVGLRRLMGMSGRMGWQPGVMKVVERLSIEPRRSLYVVEAAGEYFLVGAAESGLTMLTKLDSAEVKRIQGEKGGPGKPGGFAPFLERWKTRSGGQPPPSA